MRMKNVKLIPLALTLIIMTGCGNSIPELTAEQQDLVVEYAAGTLLKYDKAHTDRLLDISELEAIEDKRNAMEEENVAASYEKAASQEKEEDIKETAEEVDVIDRTQEPEEANASIEDFLQTEQLTFTYTGYEVADDYPNREQGEELFFVINATTGKKLLVLKFQAENASETDVELDMNQKEVRFKIVIDGEEKNALTTMLLNDLAYYQGVIGAGESRELVLVAEVSEEKAQEISDLKLLMKNVDDTKTISLN